MKVLHGANVLNKQLRTKGDACPRLLLTSPLLKPQRYELLHSVIRVFIRVIISTEMKWTVSTRRVGGVYSKNFTEETADLGVMGRSTKMDLKEVGPKYVN